MKFRATLIIGFLAIGGCGSSLIIMELSRIPSLDGAYAAVLAKTQGGGAAGSSSIEVFLVQTNETVKPTAKPVLDVAGCETVGMEWPNSKVLKVTYAPPCQVFGFEFPVHAECKVSCDFVDSSIRDDGRDPICNARTDSLDTD